MARAPKPTFQGRHGEQRPGSNDEKQADTYPTHRLKSTRPGGRGGSHHVRPEAAAVQQLLGGAAGSSQNKEVKGCPGEGDDSGFCQ